MGEQKLIAFARAMLCKPILLFLDEWTESLDENSAQRLIGIVQQHKVEGHTVIFVSHDLGIVRHLADCIVMISGGKLVAKLTAEDVASNDDLAQYIERGIAS
jgi:ABC-type multidrug transport system ATPase subunit